MKRFFFFAFVALPLSMAAQTFVQAEFLEAGLTPCGSFGTADDPPAGYHPNNLAGGLGLVGDLEKDGWDVGTPNQYCGDYFLPGSAVEGFSIEADGNVFVSANQGFVCSDSDFGLSSYTETTSGGAKLLTWSRSSNGFDIRQSSVFFRNRLLVINRIDLCNVGTSTKSDVYYQRNADPDPAQPWGGTFSTRNAVKFFGSGAGTAVTSTSEGVTGGSGPILNCYMGMASGDARAVASYGGFFFGNPSDAVNGVAPYNLSGSITADNAVQMTFDLGDMPAGACDCFAWAYVLDQTEAVDAWKATRIACPALDAFERDGDAEALASAMFGDNYDEAQRAFAWTAETGGFRLLDLEGNEQIRVYDLGGRLVHQGMASSDVQRIMQLSPGLYAVQLQAADGSVRSGKAMAY